MYSADATYTLHYDPAYSGRAVCSTCCGVEDHAHTNEPTGLLHCYPYHPTPYKPCIDCMATPVWQDKIIEVELTRE